MRKKKIICEICKIPFVSGEDTVCGPCDKNLEQLFRKQDIISLKQHALKHKCLHCGKGLNLKRFRYCESCLPDDRQLGHVNSHINFDNSDPTFLYYG